MSASSSSVAIGKWILTPEKSIELGHGRQRRVEKCLKLDPLLVAGDEPLAVGKYPLGAFEDAAKDKARNRAISGLCGPTDQLLLLSASPEAQPLVADGFRGDGVGVAHDCLTVDYVQRTYN